MAGALLIMFIDRAAAGQAIVAVVRRGHSFHSARLGGLVSFGGLGYVTCLVRTRFGLPRQASTNSIRDIGHAVADINAAITEHRR